MGEHQQHNMSTPGVMRTDFSRIENGYPDHSQPPHRYMTTADWPDMASFEASFYDPAYQASLQENIKMIKDPVFMISEVLVTEIKRSNE